MSFGTIRDTDMEKVLTAGDTNDKGIHKATRAINEDEAYGAFDRNDGRSTLATDTVNVYFSNIKRYSLLDAKEEKTLARRIARGDSRAKNRMIESNLRLVVSIAKRYVNRGMPIQDLIEEGNIGLIKSVEKFRASKGCKFSTYATYWIRQSIDRALANQSNTVRLPIHITTDLSRVMRVTRELGSKLGREPTHKEISDKAKLSLKYVKKLSLLSKKTYSLEAQLQDGSDQTLLDRIEDESTPQPTAAYDRFVVTGRLESWMSMLDDNEREIIKLRFGFDDEEPETLETVGKRFGITRERVRQIESKALDKLRRIIGKDDLVFSDVV